MPETYFCSPKKTNTSNPVMWRKISEITRHRQTIGNQRAMHFSRQQQLILR
jgi:hypothetical protein